MGKLANSIGYKGRKSSAYQNRPFPFPTDDSFLLFPQHMKRLWVSTRIAAQSMETKVSLDALAVNLLIKRRFVDSRVKDASVRKMMTLLRASYNRCVNAINEGIKRGWLVRVGTSLMAVRIHFEKEYSVLIETTEHDPKCSLSPTLTQMGNLIREAVIYNHISKQNELADTIRLATDPKPEEYEAHKRAKKHLLKKGMCVNSENASRLVGLSYRRICELVNASRTKVKTIIKSMCRRGIISVTHRFEEAGISIERFSRQLQEQHAKFAPGFMVLMDGLVHIQLANRYTAKDGKRIRLFY